MYLGEALGLGDREERLEDRVLAWEELREHPLLGEPWAVGGTALDFTGDCRPLWEGEHRQCRPPLTAHLCLSCGALRTPFPPLPPTSGKWSQATGWRRGRVGHFAVVWATGQGHGGEHITSRAGRSPFPVSPGPWIPFVGRVLVLLGFTPSPGCSLPERRQVTVTNEE